MLFSSTQPSLRARVLSRFPANVLAGAGIKIIKEGGKYTFLLDLSANQRGRSVTISFPNPSAGMQRDLWIPFSGIIKRVVMLHDVNAASTFDFWKVPYAQYPPTSLNSICGGNKLSTNSAQNKAQSTLVGWNTILNAQDIIRINCDGTFPGVGRTTIAIDGEIT